MYACWQFFTSFDSYSCWILTQYVISFTRCDRYMWNLPVSPNTDILQVDFFMPNTNLRNHSCTHLKLIHVMYLILHQFHCCHIQICRKFLGKEKHVLSLILLWREGPFINWCNLILQEHCILYPQNVQDIFIQLMSSTTPQILFSLRKYTSTHKCFKNR